MLHDCRLLVFYCTIVLHLTGTNKYKLSIEWYEFFPQAHTLMLSHPCENVSFLYCEFDTTSTFYPSVLITYRTKLLIIFLPSQITRFRYSDEYSNFTLADTTNSVVNITTVTRQFVHTSLEKHVWNGVKPQIGLIDSSHAEYVKNTAS